MQNKIFKMILKAMGITLVAVIISYFVIGKLLVFAFGYSTVEASYHLPTHTLIVGLIFTYILSALLILDKLKHR